MKREPQLVVVTGAASGIGRATAARYARKGATAIVSDIDLPGAEAAAAQIVADGGKAAAYQVDVSDAAAMQAFAAEVHAEHGVADIVVNNAGFAFGGSFMQHTDADWKRIMGVNLMGVVYGSRYFGEQMIERGTGGHLVNIASLGAYTPSSALVSYCTSKASVRMLSECLRAELAGPEAWLAYAGSRVSPGAVRLGARLLTGERMVGLADRAASTGLARRLVGAMDRNR